MREILFRGKTADNEWVYGSFNIQNGEYLNNGEYTGDEYRILGKRGECDYIDPETVGQYTGYYDSDKTKIFEDDIVLVPYIDPIFNSTWDDKTPTEKAIVKFEKGMFCIEYLEGGYKFTLQAVQNHVIVIGNIHDNCELLN